MIVAASFVLLAGGLLAYTLLNRDSGGLQVSPARIDWTAAAGSSEISVDGGSFAFEVTSRSPWISIQPGRGTAPARVHITRKPGLTGPQDGELLVRRLDGSGQTKTVPVHVNAALPVSLPGSLQVSPTALSLNEHDAKGQVQVSSSAGARRFSVRITEGNDWLTVQPSSGSTPAFLVVGYLPAKAPAGNSAGELVCETEDGQRSQIAVSLTVAAASAPAPIRVDPAAMLRSLTYKVVPVYPETAKLARIQGPVKFAARIGKDGSVESLHLVSGHPLLVKGAEDAVIQFRYKPTLVNGQPVVVATEITVNFTLK
jgi:TonB family protein